MSAASNAHAHECGSLGFQNRQELSRSGGGAGGTPGHSSMEFSPLSFTGTTSAPAVAKK